MLLLSFLLLLTNISIKIIALLSCQIYISLVDLD